MQVESTQIAIIGGSGLYELPGFNIIKRIEVETPFGKPSDEIVIAEIHSKRVAFLPRHGKGHIYLPSSVPVKANIFALKTLGVKYIIAISAVGSLQEEIAPEDFILPDQIIDRTKGRASSFFEDEMVGHISFADPFENKLSAALAKILSQRHEKKTHLGGTYICMEGPAFSTRAESNLYRLWGASVIGMTALPEAKLAREAEIAYAMVAMVTDYDCWRENTEAVSVEMLMDHMAKNTKRIKKQLPEMIEETAQLGALTQPRSGKVRDDHRQR